MVASNLGGTEFAVFRSASRISRPLDVEETSRVEFRPTNLRIADQPAEATSTHRGLCDRVDSFRLARDTCPAVTPQDPLGLTEARLGRPSERMVRPELENAIGDLALPSRDTRTSDRGAK